LLGKIKGRGDVLIVTTERALQDFLEKGIEVTPIKEIDYKKGRMILARIKCS